MSSGEQRFRRLVDALDHAIVWEFDDTEQQYTFVSEHSKLVLGHDCREWIKDPGFFERHVIAEDQPKLGEALGKIRAGQSNDMRLEHRCIKNDGTIVWVHTGVHRADEAGKVLLRGVTIDINNVKRAEERERAAKEEAQRTTRAYEEIMAIISHDLRTPLQSIALAARTLGRDTRLADRLAPTIAGSAAQMERLIDDLTDLSQIRTKKLKVTPTEISTHEILRDVLERFGPIAEASAVRLTSALDEPIVLRCDPKRIAQVL
ncbi:MAG: PAS domain S-box protein, partial [Proteobacteria bacterium]